MSVWWCVCWSIWSTECGVEKVWRIRSGPSRKYRVSVLLYFVTPRLCCFGLNPALSMFSSLTGLVHVQTMGTLHVRNTVFHPDKHPPNFRYGNQAVLTVAHLETSKGHFSHTFYIAKIDNADTMCKIEKYLCNKRGGTPLEMFSMVPAPAPEPLNSQWWAHLDAVR